MMKTALSIIQSVRYRLNLPAPTTLVSVTDPDELQMIHLLYAVCEELRGLRCWPQLKRNYSFTTSASRTKYYLPPDFYAPLLETHWNQTEDERLNGPVLDDQMNYYLYSGASSTAEFSYRIFGMDENSAGGNGQFEINPSPTPALYVAGTTYAVGDQVTSTGTGGYIYICTTAITTATTAPTGTTTSADDTGVWTYVSAWTGDTLSFDYLTRTFILPKDWAASTAFSAATYCNCNGRIYYTSAGGTTGSTDPEHTSGSSSDGGVTWVYAASYQLKETVTTDTDLVVFDDDLVKLGIRAKWMEEKGGNYEAAAAEYQSKIDRAVARYHGSYVGSMTERSRGPTYSTQFKSWTF